MPQLIRTPEQVLRETRRDLYFIRFNQWDPFTGSRHHVPGKHELLEWFKNHLPHVELEELGQMESSGWIEGGFGQHLRVDFGEVDLAVYVAAWEEPDGKNKDERWQCYIYPYEDYLQRAQSGDDAE